MKRSLLNYWVDVCLLITTILTFLTGIIKFPGFLRMIGISPRNLPLDFLMLIHDWCGLGIGLFAVIHLVLHWSWMKKMTGSILRRKSVCEKQF